MLTELLLRLLICRMATDESASSKSLLLALPDPCLLAVLQCLAAEDYLGLFSAARAHSRLRQIAVEALTSITAKLRQQHKMDKVLLYLDTHSHVTSIDFRAIDHMVFIGWLPQQLQLRSMQLSKLYVQLQEGEGFPGVLGDAASLANLKQLRLSDCQVWNKVDGFWAMGEAQTAALINLPAGLEHLSISRLHFVYSARCWPTAVLQQLQQLTCLELSSMYVKADDSTPAMHPMHALTRMADLRLSDVYDGRRTVYISPSWNRIGITASMLSNARHLTRLQLSDLGIVQASVLAGKTRLQHLHLDCSALFSTEGEGKAQLLSDLQHLQQLTHLAIVDYDCHGNQGSSFARAAYAVFTTASSTLQHLDLSGMRLPATGWCLEFPAGKWLPQLTYVDISVSTQTSHNTSTPALEGKLLVECCPALQSLHVIGWQYSANQSADQLAPLQSLSGLHTLGLGGKFDVTPEHVKAMAQLSALQHLKKLRYQGASDPYSVEAEVRWF